ncbi:MAG: hypothetical protein IJJ43_06305 [Oscillospiraceae bacterium]|nr:hypothetical protein [Oscillospiraceae bacterium]MBQ6465860.1 hypothetical protein [Oscillospiraceae bacterium]
MTFSLSQIARCYAATVGRDSYTSEKDVTMRLKSSISRQQTNVLDDDRDIRNPKEIYDQTIGAECSKKSGKLPLKRLQGKHFVALA